MNTDVIIVGAGVAGLTLSYLLKERNINHLVLDRVSKPKNLDLAETMPPSALVLLESLNLLELFSQSSSKTFGYHSLWNNDFLTTDNFFRHNPFKYGLKLNKTKLLNDMRVLVSDHLIPMNHLVEIDRSNENISVKIKADHSIQTINGRLIVDATGRSRNVLKHFGISSESFDDQVALSCHLPYFKHPQLIHSVYVESFENGWGIVSSLNDQTNVMTLYTKKGSPILPKLKDYQNWKALLSSTRILKDFLVEDIYPKVVGQKANSSKASQISGSNWLAIGDAAIAFDPLSSHGVSNAIFCSKSASEAIELYLTSDVAAPFQNYDQTINRIFHQYLKQKSSIYSLQQ